MSHSRDTAHSRNVQEKEKGRGEKSVPQPNPRPPLTHPLPSNIQRHRMSIGEAGVGCAGLMYNRINQMTRGR